MTQQTTGTATEKDRPPIIVIGTDFSAESRRALAKACEIGRGLGACLHLVHVVEPVDDAGSSDPETARFYEALTESAHVKLGIEIDTIPSAVDKVSSAVEIGHRAPTLLAIAEAIKATFLVLGSRPASRESVAATGLGVSHRVAISSSSVPVLLVP